MSSMKRARLAGVVVMAAATVATATPTLQFDVNGFGAQAHNSAGANSAFGGLSHTGSLGFSLGSGTIQGIFMQTAANGPYNNAHFAGFTMTGFSGQINLVNGHVTDGSITITINNGDSYTCGITPGSGLVSTYVGGGFQIQALTQNGFFNDAQFGNVGVGPWFAAQGAGGLAGSFLQFNFDPNASGAAFSDMDLFVDVVPLPPASWGAAATLAIAMAVRFPKRRNA